MTEWFERNRGFVLVTLINLALIGGAFFWLKRPAPAPVEILEPVPTPSPAPTTTPTLSTVRVYVTGAVANPDVYELPPGSIVKDALQAAGGATQDADLIHINLAQELGDQQQLYVPTTGEDDAPPPVIGGATASSAGGLAQDGKINLNTASLEELDSLPGIGPAFAQRIVDYRENNGSFQSIEEIKLVSGIGDATFEKIKDRISVGN